MCSERNKKRIARRRRLVDRTEKEMERVYRKGYEKIPETPEIAISQEKMLAEILPAEVWRAENFD